MFRLRRDHAVLEKSTEAGVKEPQATILHLLRRPLSSLAPKVYAEMLGRRLREHDANVGWSTPAGKAALCVGKRMDIPYTRAMVDGAVEGSLAQSSSKSNPPSVCTSDYLPGRAVELLNPRNSWQTKPPTTARPADLCGRFAKNFEQFDARKKSGRQDQDRRSRRNFACSARGYGPGFFLVFYGQYSHKTFDQPRVRPCTPSPSPPPRSFGINGIRGEGGQIFELKGLTRKNPENKGVRSHDPFPYSPCRYGVAKGSLSQRLIREFAEAGSKNGKGKFEDRTASYKFSSRLRHVPASSCFPIWRGTRSALRSIRAKCFCRRGHSRALFDSLTLVRTGLGLVVVARLREAGATWRKLRPNDLWSTRPCTSPCSDSLTARSYQGWAWSSWPVCERQYPIGAENSKRKSGADGRSRFARLPRADPRSSASKFRAEVPALGSPRCPPALLIL